MYNLCVKKWSDLIKCYSEICFEYRIEHLTGQPTFANNTILSDNTEKWKTWKHFQIRIDIFIQDSGHDWNGGETNEFRTFIMLILRYCEKAHAFKNC